uniref:Receptor ligand binding region domain-containing protein n=1 Tax=Salvator merianae TaxID=96440 RepID=A0A8D0B5Z2_SALMN
LHNSSCLFFQSHKQPYHHQIFSLIFAIDEINKNPRLLPNITLGFHIYDDMFNLRTSYEAILDLLFTQLRNMTNYKCDRSKNILTDFSYMSSYQLTYGAYDTPLRRNTEFPFMHQMTPGDPLQPWGIIQLLIYFKWTWIDLIVSNDDSGERFVQAMASLLAHNSICVSALYRLAKSTDFIISAYSDYGRKMNAGLISSKANVVIASGDSFSLAALIMWLEANEFITNIEIGKVWIITTRWDFTQSIITVSGFPRKTFHGTLSFSIHRSPLSGFHDFLNTLNSDNSLMQFLCVFWQVAFGCTIPELKRTQCNKHLQCTGNEELWKLPLTKFEMDMTGESYSVYNAVYAVAHSLLAIYESRSRSKLHNFLKNAHFNNGVGHEILVENGRLSVGYDIINWVMFPNASIHKVQVGNILPSHEFTVAEDFITWNGRFKQVGSTISVCQYCCRASFGLCFVFSSQSAHK